MFDSFSVTLEVIAALLAIAGVIWAIVKAVHRHNERFLFFSSCHIIPLTLRDDIVKQHHELKEKLSEHAFAPLVILPNKLKNYFRVKNGDRVILRFSLPGGDESIVTANAFWYPDSPELWDNFDQPALSLVLRRYFGIERPLLGNENTIPDGWKLIKHGTTRSTQQGNLKEMEILHRTSVEDGKLIWLANSACSSRFWNPDSNNAGAKYSDTWQDGSFLEYSGVALKISRPSLLTLV